MVSCILAGKGQPLRCLRVVSFHMSISTERCSLRNSDDSAGVKVV